MTRVDLRNADLPDFEVIVALNSSEERHTSAMSLERLRVLHTIAWRHVLAVVDEEVAGFVLAMRDSASYANANFEWFAARYVRFAYVDRIVVGARWQDLQIGTRLYDELLTAAQDAGLDRVTCEYNVVPPNEPSRRFHDRFGFREVGRRSLEEGNKTVSMQAVELPRAAPTSRTT